LFGKCGLQDDWPTALSSSRMRGNCWLSLQYFSHPCFVMLCSLLRVGYKKKALHPNMCVALCKKLSSSQSYARRKEDRPIFVQGDWSRIGQAHLRGLPPVRSVGLTRVMATHFRLFLIDEYGSSSRHHKTFEPVTNVYTPKGRKLHSVLILPEKSYGHIQRDTLACLNQRAIYNHWVAIGKRHPGFVRL
jgi:hypothetical protein